jgi:protein TonB
MIALLLLFAAQPAPGTPPSAIRIEVVDPPRPRLPTQSLINPLDYPAAALGTGAHGRVSVLLKVDEQGRVAGCTVTQSSGFATLDSATCKLLQRRDRFDPARDVKSGTPVPGRIVQSVDWKAR